MCISFQRLCAFVVYDFAKDLLKLTVPKLTTTEKMNIISLNSLKDKDIKANGILAKKISWTPPPPKKNN